MSKLEHTQESTDHNGKEKGDNLDQRVCPEESGLPDLQLD